MLAGSPRHQICQFRHFFATEDLGTARLSGFGGPLGGAMGCPNMAIEICFDLENDEMMKINFYQINLIIKLFGVSYFQTSLHPNLRNRHGKIWATAEVSMAHRSHSSLKEGQIHGLLVIPYVSMTMLNLIPSGKPT